MNRVTLCCERVKLQCSRWLAAAAAAAAPSRHSLTCVVGVRPQRAVQAVQAREVVHLALVPVVVQARRTHLVAVHVGRRAGARPAVPAHKSRLWH